MWRGYVGAKWRSKQNFLFLAVSIPSIEDKSPKGMEEIVSSFFGLSGWGTFSQQFWQGRQPQSMSLEIVGIGGTIRFVIMIPAGIKDYIEATIYSQYPDAEIMEVEDYSQVIPMELLESEYDWFATELKLAKSDAYPIKTYLDFEHGLTGEIIDPISAFSEVLSLLKPTEQLWLQIVIRPANDGWRKAGLKEVDKLMKRVKKSSKPIIPTIPIVNDFINEMIDVISATPSAAFGEVTFGEKEKKKEAFEKMEFLSPGERTSLEAIERNLSKLGFETKMRAIYLAPKADFNPSDRVSAFFGIMGQFASQDLNAFAPHKRFTTKVDYFFPTPRVEGRKRRLMHWYRAREMDAGGKLFVLNTEELATVFHFPSEKVVAPSLERPEAKKATAPPNLPLVPEE